MVAFCLSFSLMLIISITTKMFFPSLLGAITGRSSYGYFSFINQAPVFSLGIYLFFSYDAKKKANGGVVFEAIVSACLFLAALILFMKPKILLSYTISEYMVSVSAFLLLRIFIKLETEEKIRIIPPIKAIVKVGQNSLYIYLTHFLVLSEPLKIIKNILLEHTNKISDALLYFGLLIPTIFMCYYVGIVYKTIVRLVTTNSNKDKKKSNL